MTEILDIVEYEDFAARSARHMADRRYLPYVDVDLVADIIRAVVAGVREALDKDDLAGQLEAATRPDPK